jgi:hypothetical protein
MNMTKSRTGKARSGGGITSNKLVRPKIRVAPRTTDVVSPSGVADIGASISYPRQPVIKGTAQDRAPMGNDLAASCKQGPGGGRDIYKSGFQSLHGAVAKGEGKIGPNAGKDILSEFGPDKKVG